MVNVGLENDTLGLCAHRGYHNARDENDPERFLENTLPAYQEAFEWVNIAECDVQLLKDGTIVLVHDSSFLRVAEVSNGLESLRESKAIRSLQLSERVLEQLDLLRDSACVEVFSNLLVDCPLLCDLWERSALKAEAYDLLPKKTKEEIQWLLALAPIEELTFEQANRIVLKRGASVSKLEWVIELLQEGGRHLVIEIKPADPRIVEALFPLLSRMNAWECVSIMSFDAELMRALCSAWIEQGGTKTMGAALQTYWLVCTHQHSEVDSNRVGFLSGENDVPALCERLRNIGVSGVYLEFNETTVTRSVIRAFVAAGFRVGIWSGRPEHENIDTLKFLSASGASIINTDEPVKLIQSLAKRALGDF